MAEGNAGGSQEKGELEFISLLSGCKNEGRYKDFS